MKKEEYEEYLNLALSTGADFAEIYYEKSKNKNYKLYDSKLDTIDSISEIGIGIRITKEEESYYTSTNILTKDNIYKTINNLLNNFNKEESKIIKLNELVDKTYEAKKKHDKYPIENKKRLLYNIDKIARDYSNLVTQVSVTLTEIDKEFVIANSESKFIKGNSILSRIGIVIYTEKEERKEHEFIDFASNQGYEFLDKINYEEKVKDAAKNAIEKLTSIDFKGGEYPVVIAPGFGAVIFHEACGHGLEATSVAPKLSIFSNDYGKKIASEKVTLIDDGTIPKSWGSFIIDDEGNESQKNVLIEKGILKNYLIDNFNSKKMKKISNGCGRRQNYRFEPTSRMSNTYLAPGNDKFIDMIKSIKLGIYCEKMSGGSVNPSTGDFNFAVDTARVIQDGKLGKLVRGITLIGNSKEILKNVEMVSDDLVISAGYCGSKSGLIPVTIGQPTIKISKILVGGKSNEL